MITGLPSVVSRKWPHVFRQVPEQLLVLADGAVAGDGGDQ
jgi:hypothetical protein